MLGRATLWLRVGVGVAVGAGAALAALAWTPPVYTATTSILIESIGGDDVNLRTEAELVGSTQIAADALARLTGDPRAGGGSRAVTAGRLAGVEPVPGTSVLRIIVESATAQGARDGATAFAEAYLAARAESAREALNAEIASVQHQLTEIRTQLGDVNARIDQSPSNTSELESLRATQASLSAQSASLSSRLSELQSTTINPGRVVAQPGLPAAPVRPNRLLYLVTATTLGALAGGALHVLGGRWSRRVRRGADLRRHSIPVLTELGTVAPVVLGGHQDPNGRAFGRLRNEVEAALTPSDHILLVTAATPGPASTLVAANLAAAFARTDNDVVLVGASVPELDGAPPATVATIFDLADIPGLTDVLAGRTSLARALQRAARVPRLQVVTPGGTASAGGLLQSEGARSVLRQLAMRTRYVIVDAPSTASGADAQSLASTADAALLVVEADHATHTEVADAATQLQRVGTRLLGAVVVPSTAGAAASLSTSDDRAARPVAVAVPAYETEGWISARADALDGPTTKLDVVNRRPPASARAQRDAGSLPRDDAAPAENA